MQAFIAIWAIFVSIVGLNGLSAGVAAVLHIWRGKQSRRSRILAASAVTGLFPTCVIVPPMLASVSDGAEAPLSMIVGAVGVFVATFATSLPGAAIVARKLEGPGDAYRAFE